MVGSIGDGLIEWVRSTPDAAAVRHDGRDTSYRGLAVAARAMVEALRARGARPGDRVGLAVAPGPDLVAALVAVAALGATYVPLDNRHASRRLADILARAGCALVVVDATTSPVVTEAAGPRVHVDELRGTGDRPLDLEDLAGSPDAALYAMFTSGSTGTPKGVLIPHAAVVQLIAGIGEVLPLPPGLVWSMVHSPAFDFSTWELWGALLTGGTVAIARPADIADPAALAAFVAAESVAVWSQTPSSFRRITADPALIRAATAGGALRHIVFGGEPLPSAVVRPWAEAVGLVEPRLINMYGITETTVHSTQHVVTAASLGRPHCPIGVALPGRGVTVRDGDGRELPPGTVGELWVGGEGLAIGYLDDPTLTAARFVHVGGERLYRSGDLGHADADGVLHHEGRMDREVKVRGHRVALEEVESGVRRQPGVRDAVAVAMPHPAHGGTAIVAYIVGGDLDELAGRLLDEFPAHMVPARLVPIDALPLNANGKLDPAALPDAWATAPEHAGDRAEDAADVAGTVRRAFAEVLGYPLEDVAADADFFGLGGDSLLAVYVFDAARVLRERLSITDLFADPTPAGLARRWHEREPAPPAAAVPVGAVPVGAVIEGERADEVRLPLTRAQEGLIVEWLTSGSSTYQVGLLVQLAVPGSVEDVEAAVRALGAAHPALRTRIDLDAIGEEVRIGEDAEVCVVTRDDRGMGLAGGLDAARRWIADERRARFDLAKQPPLRFRVAALAGGGFAVAIVGHHVICDGWSLSVLVRDIVDLCRGTVTAAALAERGAHHLDALRALPRLELADIAALHTAARNRGSEAEPSAFSPDVTAAANATGPATEHVRLVAPELHAAAVAFAHAQRVPVKSVYVAAHLAAVGAADSPTVAGCVTLSGRPDGPDAQTCVGYFVRPRIVTAARGDTAARFIGHVWAGEQEQLMTRHAPVSAQLDAFPRDMPPALVNYIDFHVLHEDAVLAREAYDENSFPLLVDIDARTSATGTRITVRGRGDGQILDRIAEAHVTALAALVTDGTPA